MIRITYSDSTVKEYPNLSMTRTQQYSHLVTFYSDGEFGYVFVTPETSTSELDLYLNDDSHGIISDAVFWSQGLF